MSLDQKALDNIRGNIRIYDNRVAERDVKNLLGEVAELREQLAAAHAKLNALSTPQAIEDRAEGQRFREAREREASKLVTEVFKAWHEQPHDPVEMYEWPDSRSWIEKPDSP